MPVTQATIHQAKTHLSKLIRQALAGEEIVIANRDKPLVRLQVIKPTKARRQLGWGKGLVTYIAPDFDEPLPEFAEYIETSEEARARLYPKRSRSRKRK